MLAIDLSSAASNSASVWLTLSPSVRAREKLAISHGCGQEGVGFLAAVAARQCDHPQHLRVADEVGVEIVTVGSVSLTMTCWSSATWSRCSRMAGLEHRSRPRPFPGSGCRPPVR